MTNPYLDRMIEEDARKARTTMSQVGDANPDTEAKLQGLAKRYGLPLEAVRLDPAPVQRQASADQFDYKSLAERMPVTLKQLGDPAKAAVVKDDVENLGAVETVLGKIKNFGMAGVSGVQQASAGVLGFGQSIFDLAAPALDPLVGRLLPVNPFRVAGGMVNRDRRAIEATAQGNMPRAEGNIEAGVYSGAASLSRNLMALPLAFLPGGQNAALTAMMLPVYGQEYGKARDAGLSPERSVIFGGTQAGIELATEKLAFTRLVGDIKAGSTLWKTLKRQIGPEVIGEQAATVLQDFNDWASLNPEKPFREYLEARPDAAVQTLVATLVGVGGQVGTVKAIEGAVNLAQGRKQKAQEAKGAAELFRALNDLAKASKVRGRSADTFEAFVAQALEDGPFTDVFIDGKVLMQSGVAEQIARVSPSVAEQITTAAQTGTDVRIPVEEFTTKIAGTEFARGLLEHLKTDPDGFSQAQAEKFLQTEGPALQAAVDKTMAEREGDAVFKASTDVVKTKVLEQLSAANRFTGSVNDAYATLVGNFFAVTAAKAGLTPEQLFEKYPLRVRANRVGGSQFEQEVPDSPKSLADVRRQWAEAGIDNFISETGDTIHISQIIVPKTERNLGKGTRALETLVRYADQKGLRVTLTPSADFGGNKKRLVEFYKRFGFVENKGRNKDYSTAESMYRPARGADSDSILKQTAKGKRDEYTFDLFGVPVGTGATGAATGTTPSLVSRNDTLGEFATRTEIVTDGTRQLGASRVNTPQDAAQAMAYLSKNAVERFDALITDKDGKPLALVGSFKGAISSAAVYPETIVGEAFRVEGAANIWFAHNHPSGTAEFSPADRKITERLGDAFRGSGIKPRGMLAIAGKEGDGRKWVFSTVEDIGTENGDVKGATRPPTEVVEVPIVERVFAEEGKLGEPIKGKEGAFAAAKNLGNKRDGVILMDSMNVPVAFIPVNASEMGELRRDGRMDALYRAISTANAAAAFIVDNGGFTPNKLENLAGLFSANNVRVLDVLEVSGGKQKSWAYDGWSAPNSFLQTTRGTFNPDTNTISLLKNADLSTFLHEAGHFFLEVQFDLAAQMRQEADVFGATSEQQAFFKDTDALLKWFGVTDLAEWYNLDFEEKRSYHEKFARGFEAYLFEGKTPSIELQGLFQRFRAWLVNVYKDIVNLDVELTDEVRNVFDRMLATSEQIALTEQARSILPMFDSAQIAGMTPEEFADYQAKGAQSTADAIEQLQARGLRDLQWLRNQRNREIKKLQKLTAQRRAEARIEVRNEVMQQPVYRAWQFLTAKLTDADKVITDPKLPTSAKDELSPEVDSLFVAIAKLGGLRRAEVESQWGWDPKERSPTPKFGKPLLRKEGGKTLDEMGALLAESGYLPLDENGKHDQAQFEELFDREYRGDPQYSSSVDPLVLQGIDDIRAGELAPLAQLGAGRLDRASLKEDGYSNEDIAKLEGYGMVRKTGGLDPDLIAEPLGFTGGDHMVKALLEATPLRDEIEGLTDAKMLELYGDLSSPQAVERAADQAVHNEARAKFLAAELGALEKAMGPKAGKNATVPKAAKAWAQALIGRQTVRKLKPTMYASAAAKAGQSSLEALKKGDTAQAAVDKRNQLVNTYAARAAYDAQDEIEAALRYFTKFDREGVRKSIDLEYLEQIEGILERFDFRKGQSLKNIDKRKTLAEWVESQADLGIDVELPDKVRLEMVRQSYKDMTVDEVRGLVETIKQIEHLGRLKEKLLTAADNRRFADVISELVNSINDNAPDGVRNNRTRENPTDRVAMLFKGFLAAHRKTSSLARQLDGFKDAGPMWRYFIEAMNRAGDREATMQAEANKALSAMLAPVLKEGKTTGKGQFFPSLGLSLNKGERIVIALNMGNEGNLQRLLDGRGWTLERVAPVLDTLSENDWKMVQQVWDFFESYKPIIAEKERRVMGKEPNWVEPMPLTTKFGTLRGGYFPIVYDPRESGKSEQQADAEGARQQMRGAFAAATTRRTFTKARAEEVSGRPLVLTWDALFRGVNDVIHDLSWHEWVIDTNRILRNEAFDKAVRTRYGAETPQQFKAAVRDIAAGDIPAQDALGRVLSPLRKGAAVAGLGLNLMNAFIQPLGLTQSMVRIGPRWVAQGVARWAQSPVELVRDIHERSEFMRNRGRTQQREINEIRGIVQGKGEIRQKLDALMFAPMQSMQLIADVPTWWGAYQKALAGIPDDVELDAREARAVALADQAVLDAQSGGQVKDLALVQRGSELQKLFTVFYGYFSAAYNLGVERAKATNYRSPLEVMHLAGDFLLLYSVPAVLAVLIKEALQPGDDDEDLATKLAAEQLSFLMGTMVGVRELTGAFQWATDTKMFDHAYGGPAGLRFFQELDKLGKQIGQGDLDRAMARSAINVGGVLLALPSAQVNRTIDGIIAISEGQTENPAALLFGVQQ